METLAYWWHWLIEAVGASHPALLFAGMALLPLAGVPISPLWIAAGIRLGAGVGVALAAGALLINFSLGYWVARGWLHGPLSRWLMRRGYPIPHLNGADEMRLILLLRVAPGVPLCVQNYLLGLARVGFGRYLLFSLPIQSAYAFAFVGFGNSLSGSSLWRIILAGAGLVAVALCVSLLRRRMKPCKETVVRSRLQVNND